jgi:repressor LexA
MYKYFMRKNTEISARINQIIDYLGITANEFAKNLGYDRGQTVYDILNSKSAPSFDFFNKFGNTEYSDLIDLRWLLTGKGEMLKTHKKELAVSLSGEGIPLVSIEAYGGLLSMDTAIADSDIMARYLVPDFEGADFMLRVTGNSMAPTYNSGDVVACCTILDSCFIQWGRPHIIATREQGIMIKRIRPGKNETHYTAISDNPHYDPFQIPANEITGLALVKGVIRIE